MGQLYQQMEREEGQTIVQKQVWNVLASVFRAEFQQNGSGYTIITDRTGSKDVHFPKYPEWDLSLLWVPQKPSQSTATKITLASARYCWDASLAFLPVTILNGQGCGWASGWIFGVPVPLSMLVLHTLLEGIHAQGISPFLPASCVTGSHEDLPSVLNSLEAISIHQTCNCMQSCFFFFYITFSVCDVFLQFVLKSSVWGVTNAIVFLTTHSWRKSQITR